MDDNVYKARMLIKIIRKFWFYKQNEIKKIISIFNAFFLAY